MAPNQNLNAISKVITYTLMLVYAIHIRRRKTTTLEMTRSVEFTTLYINVINYELWPLSF